MTVTAHSANSHEAPANRGFGDAASRALVPAGAVSETDPERYSRCNERAAGLSSGFLAHLIATRDKVPQTRTRRRAEPEDACQHYDAADAAVDMGDSRIIRTL